MSAKKIILTGGGTAGHVTPNIALLLSLKAKEFDVVYVGSHNGMEKDLIKEHNIKYRSVSSGKLRRYLSMKNFTDIFRVFKGFGDAKTIIKNEKPDIIFSKGGFVTVPVVIAASRLKIPVVIHESDITPGLANKICYPFADKICVSFPETIGVVPKNKGTVTGMPLRAELLRGDRNKGLELCGFDGRKPVLLIIGGSLGSLKINECVTTALDDLLKTFDIAHIRGKGNVRADISASGYKQFDYVSDKLSDLFALADMIVSRAGANAINEFLALKKPNLLIPLSKNASRGDQILNAESFEKRGFSGVLPEEELSPETLIAKTLEIFRDKESYIKTMINSPLNDGVSEVMNIIVSLSC